MIDPKNVALFQPSELKKFKAELFGRIGEKIKAKANTDIAKATRNERIRSIRTFITK